ncbi:MAG: MFS transporter [Pedobacter sp.]|nr:MAG: MFS transporter [Pedobacter sp.]
MDNLSPNPEVVSLEPDSYKERTVRLAISLFYFIQGISFASWASRIPDLKSSLNLSDAALGSILLALPLGQLITMPFSGKMTSKYGSLKVLRLSVPLYSFVLVGLGLANSGWQLAFVLLLFGISGNLCNIALNTQAVAAESYFKKPIMTSFHGAWSIGGFTGALIGLGMMNFHISPMYHFVVVMLLAWLNVALSNGYLIRKKKVTEPHKAKLFQKPSGVLIQLGIIGFCSMATEGAMFDWSGVYFKDIVKAPHALIILGYASFMIMMATGRFLGDNIIQRFGRKRSLQVSGFIITAGMFLSVLFPHIISATLGFMLVGLGVSGIVPMVYSVAGTNTKVAPSMAIAMVSSVSYLGFLMGPPLIGYISALANLRYSYALIGCFGIIISMMVSRLKAISN